MAEVVAAFIITVASVFSIIVLDRLADKQKHCIQEASASKWCKCCGVKEDAIESALDTIDYLLRKVIETFGIVVGLSWEKACHGALETVIEKIEVAESHRVISNAI